MLAGMMTKSATDLCAAVSVMDKNTWPTEIDPQYGEDQVRLLCTKFLVPFSNVKHSVRDYKESTESTMTGSLNILQNRNNTLPISTAICSSLRSRLTVQHRSSLLFISICGPPINLWQNLTYVTS